MLAIVHGRVRQEERMLQDACERLAIPVRFIHDESLVLTLDRPAPGSDHPLADVTSVLIRSVSTSRGLAIAQAVHRMGIPVVNAPDVAATCSDKASTSWALHAAGVPTPETRVAFGIQAALDTMDAMGYPLVLKPVTGSWARLVHRVRDRDEAEQVLEARGMLPNPTQHIHYIQRYVDTTDDAGQHRDIRAFVIGHEIIAAVHRVSTSWVTNTARGASTQNVEITPDLDRICRQAARAVGGGILAIDLMETPDGLVVHEVNHTMEFRNSVDVTGVDIPGRMVQFAAAQAEPPTAPSSRSRPSAALSLVTSAW